MSDLSDSNPVNNDSSEPIENKKQTSLSTLDEILDKVASGDFEMPKMNVVEDIADLVPDEDKTPVQSQPQTNKRKQNLGRKNIRKIDESQLDNVVLEAQKAESARLKRISEKEKFLTGSVSSDIVSPNNLKNESTEFPDTTDLNSPPSKMPRLSTDNHIIKEEEMIEETDLSLPEDFYDDELESDFIETKPFPFSPSTVSSETTLESQFGNKFQQFNDQLPNQRNILSRAPKTPAVSLPPSVLPPASSRFSTNPPTANNDHYYKKLAGDPELEHRSKMMNLDSAMKRPPPGYEISSSGLIFKSFTGDSMDNAIMLGDSDDEDLDLIQDDDFTSDLFTSDDEEHREVIELSDADDEDDVTLDDLSEEARQDAESMAFDPSGRILINKGHPENEPDYYLAPQISRTIKPHQVSGIRFLYDNVVESSEQFESEGGFGCILAHSMGLGKTIQIIGFLDIVFRCVQARSALIIVPINTLQNWQAEIEMWLPIKTTNQPENTKSVPTETPSECKEDKQSASESDGQQCNEESSQTTTRPFTLYVVKDTLKSMEARYQVVQTWHENGGVLLIGYEMFRLVVGRKNPNKKAASLNNRKKPISIDIEVEEKKASMWEGFYRALVNPGPQMVICDEGHRIKNSEASISKALKSIRTRRRIVMTGYPLQNNLIEYWCMVDFVRPNYLGTKQNFTNMFQRPIENGQCIDSNEEDRKLMQGRAHVLHELLAGFVQRRSHAVLKASLPKKQEVVLLIKMSPVQRRLYSAFMDSLSGRGLFTWAQNNTLNTYAVCCKIWNHPDVLWRVVRDLQAKDDAFDFDIEDNPNSGAISQAGSQPTAGKSSRQKNKKRSVLPPSASSPALIRPPPTSASIGPSQDNKPGFPLNSDSSSLAASEEDSSNLSSMQTLHTNPYVAAYMSAQPEPGINYEWLSNDLWTDYAQHVSENGGKIVLLLSLLKECVEAGDKMLVFSQSLLTLDLIEDFLKITALSESLQPKDAPDSSKPSYWSKNDTYYRLDGSTSASERERLINSFNQVTNRARLFLLSTRAGCLGVNLVGANRVVVFDASWNPCHDCQAVCRVYRYGQTKQCYIYRLVTDNTMEKKIYDRQVTKQGMSDRVVDELNPGQQFTRQQVEQLMDYVDKDLDAIKSEQIDEWTNCEDELLKKILHDNANWITKLPFTHESLLIDQRDYRLTKYEKMRAKQRYEEEKRQQLFQRPMYMDFFPRGQMPMPPIDHRPSILSRPRPSILSGGNFTRGAPQSMMSPMSGFDHLRQMNRQSRISAFTMQMEEARRRYNMMKNGGASTKEMKSDDDAMSQIPPPPPRLSLSGRDLESRNQKSFPLGLSRSELKESPIASHPRSLSNASREVSQMMNNLITNKPTISKSVAGNSSSLNKPGNSTPQSSDCKITRIQATTDLFFPGTTTVTNSQRKIAKGEVMEVIQTSKSKYLRVPRTGDLYVVRTNSNLCGGGLETSPNSSSLNQTTSSTLDTATKSSTLFTPVCSTAEFPTHKFDPIDDEDSNSQSDNPYNSCGAPIDSTESSIMKSDESKLDSVSKSVENSPTQSLGESISDNKIKEDNSKSIELAVPEMEESVMKDDEEKEEEEKEECITEAITTTDTNATTNSTLDSIISLVAAGGGTNDLPDRRTITNQMKDAAAKEMKEVVPTELSQPAPEIIPTTNIAASISPPKPKPKRVRPSRSKKKPPKSETDSGPTATLSASNSSDRPIKSGASVVTTQYQNPAIPIYVQPPPQQSQRQPQYVEQNVSKSNSDKHLPDYSNPVGNESYQPPFIPPPNQVQQQQQPPIQSNAYQPFPSNQNFVNVGSNDPSTSMIAPNPNQYTNFDMKPDLNNVHWQVQNSPAPPPQAPGRTCCGCNNQMMNPNCTCTCHGQNNQYSSWMPQTSQTVLSNSNHAVQNQPITNYYQINNSDSINAPQMMPVSTDNMQPNYDANFPNMVANNAGATPVYFYQNAPTYQAAYADPFVNSSVNASYVQPPPQTTIYTGPQILTDHQLAQNDSDYFYTTQPQFQQQSQPINSMESSREFYFPEL